MAEQQTRRIELDFVRGIAILLAMGWHFNQVHIGIAPLDWLIAPGRLFGWAGVDLFFVLSGFLIGGLLFGEFQRQGDFHAPRFLIRRAFKIWPIFYAFLALQLILRDHPWRSYVFQNLLHVQNYWTTSIPHQWSLAVEEHFYLTFAVVYALMIKRLGDARAMPWFLLALAILALGLRIWATAAHVDSNVIQVQSQFRIDALACGVFIAYVRAFHASAFERLASKKVMLAAAWLAGAIMLANVGKHGQFISSIGYTLTYLAAAAFLLFCYGLKPIVQAGFVLRPIAALGTYSYALYIYQFAALRPAAKIAAKLHLTGAAAPLFTLAADYSAAIVVAVIVTKAMERPFLMLRDKLFPQFESRRTPPASLAPDVALAGAPIAPPTAPSARSPIE